MEKKPVANGILPGPVDLAKEAWEIYKKVVITIAGLAFLQGLIILAVLIVSVIVGVIAFFVLGGKFGLPIFIVGSVLFLVFLIVEMYLTYWFTPSYIIALRDWKKQTNYRDILREGKTLLGASFVTALVVGVIEAGALFAFVLPDFIFGTWFMFWLVVVVIDKRKGLLAIHTSREYVRGHFWGVIGRSLVIYLPQMLISFILGFFGKGAVGIGLRETFQIVSLLAMPFYTSYQFAMFLHLKKLRGEVATTIPSRSKVVYLLVPILGYVVLGLSIVFVVPRAVSLAGKIMQPNRSIYPPTRVYPMPPPMMKISPTYMPLPKYTPSNT